MAVVGWIKQWYIQADRVRNNKLTAKNTKLDCDQVTGNSRENNGKNELNRLVRVQNVR